MNLPKSVAWVLSVVIVSAILAPGVVLLVVLVRLFGLLPLWIKTILGAGALSAVGFGAMREGKNR